MLVNEVDLEDEMNGDDHDTLRDMHPIHQFQRMQNRNNIDIQKLMFKPPADLLHNGSFISALNTAKIDGKLVLVNVFDGASFQCQILNRDLWNESSKSCSISSHHSYTQ